MARSSPRRRFEEENLLTIDFDDLTVHSKSRSGRSFPGIHFGDETSSKSLTADEDDEEEEETDASETEVEVASSPSVVAPKPNPRVLYIQMVRDFYSILFSRSYTSRNLSSGRHSAR